jgi:hypothetical protein
LRGIARAVEGEKLLALGNRQGQQRRDRRDIAARLIVGHRFLSW